MKGKQTARCLAFLTSTWLATSGCGPPAPPLSPPATPPIAGAPLPSKRATLSLQASFAPELTLQLALDGAPVEGTVLLRSAKRDDPEDLDDPITFLFPEPMQLEAQGGKVVVPSAMSDTLASDEQYELVIAGRRYRYPRSGNTHPFRCAQTIEAMGALDACLEPLPSAGLSPEVCDGTGTAAWLAERNKQEQGQRACWQQLDEPTLARLGQVKRSDIRALACAQLVQAAGEVIPDAIGTRLLPHCRHQLPAEYAKRLLLARRLRDIDGDYARAAGSLSNREMQLFHARYAITGDPRVEQIRTLAMKRFGPPNPARFVAARKAIEALLGGNGYSAALCSATETTAVVAVVRGRRSNVTPVGEDDLWTAAPRAGGAGGAGRACFDAMPMRMPRKPPPTLGPSAAALAKASLGVKTVTVLNACPDAGLWFLEQPAPAPLGRKPTR